MRIYCDRSCGLDKNVIDFLCGFESEVEDE